MKPITTTTLNILKTPKFNTLFISFTLLSLSLLVLLLFNHFSLPFTHFSSSTSSEISAPNPSISPPLENSPPSSPLEHSVVENTGIVDISGAMTEDFNIGDFDMDYSPVVEFKNVSDDIIREESGGGVSRAKIERYRVCDDRMRDYIPCLDNVEEMKKWGWSERGEKFERHCPTEGKGLDCLVPLPKGYQSPIPWPQSRDEVM